MTNANTAPATTVGQTALRAAGTRAGAPPSPLVAGAPQLELAGAWACGLASFAVGVHAAGPEVGAETVLQVGQRGRVRPGIPAQDASDGVMVDAGCRLHFSKRPLSDYGREAGNELLSYLGRRVAIELGGGPVSGHDMGPRCGPSGTGHRPPYGQAVTGSGYGMVSKVIDNSRPSGCALSPLNPATGPRGEVVRPSLLRATESQRQIAA